jgi:hypothetical protein
MGHVRVGRLPKSFGWSDVIASFGDATRPEEEVLRAATVAAGKTLAAAKFQDGLAYCYWLFLQLAGAARSDDFPGALGGIGVRVPSGDSGLALVTAMSSLAGSTLQDRRWIGIPDEVALQAFRAAVTDVVAEESRSLFGSTFDSVQAALRKHSTERGVARLGRRFFHEYAYRLLGRALGREASSHVGDSRRFATTDDLSAFDDRLRVYCWDISKLVEEYAGVWYSKHEWLGDVNMETTRAFTSYAIDKLLSETARELN